MAIKSTVFKVHLSVADLNRHYYEDHVLTLARHPSETDLRMLVRVVAFALNAHEHLQCAKGLSSTEEPDLWQIDLTGQIQHWIELGQPDEKRVRQSCSKANHVSVYSYQRGAHVWFEAIKDKIDRFDHLTIALLTILDESAVERLIDRTMRLNCLIEDDQVLLTNSNSDSLAVSVTTVKAPQT